MLRARARSITHRAACCAPHPQDKDGLCNCKTRRSASASCLERAPRAQPQSTAQRTAARPAAAQE
eukprot:6361545-Prymnesium_polylepis.1